MSKSATIIKAAACSTRPRRLELTALPLLLTLLTAKSCFGFTVVARRPQPRQPLLSSIRLAAASAAGGSGQGIVELKYTEFKTAAADVDGDDLEPPAIILHGLLGSKRNFASLGSSLAAQLKRRRRVIAVDLRNHGENHHDWREDMSYRSMARDVLAVLDREGLDKAVLIGHSMGGKVAKALALLEPHRISGLVVLDIAPVRYSEENDPSWSAVKGAIDALVGVSLTPGKTKRDVDKDLRPTLQDPALRAFVLTNLDQNRDTGELHWKINVDAIASQLDKIAGFDVHDGDDGGEYADEGGERPTYEGDTFFIHGGASRFVKQSHVPIISEYFPNYMLTSIRGAGHWIHAEAPDDTLALLKRYLDR